MLLESEGYTVYGAENGAVALELLEKFGMPNLILLDMIMPVMDGWVFSHEFHAKYDHKAPVVVMTAVSDAGQRAQMVGATSWIGKPFAVEDLLTLVKKHETVL